MRQWLRRMLGPRRDQSAPPAPPSTRTAITVARARLSVAESRADRVIQKAMAETDRQMFGPYRGPERRHVPR